MDLLPNIPTLSEAGVNDYEYVPWIGLIAPAGLDKGITDLLRKTVTDVVQLPKMKAQFDAQGFMPVGSSSEAFHELIKNDVELSAKLIKQAGIKAAS
jgi:tripartite-type tricarboxylate transporter receptor subunit TctC